MKYIIDLKQINLLKITNSLKRYLAILSLIFFYSCNKGGDDIPESNILQAKGFDSTIQRHNYRLVAYTSIVSFDYDPTDTVSAKTNHWEYVSLWLKDDSIQFRPGENLFIKQNINKMPTSENDISTSYKVIPDKDGVGFQFLDFTYQPLMYRLIEFSDSNFAIKASINGNEVISTFKSIQ